jgi:hypothetical protein
MFGSRRVGAPIWAFERRGIACLEVADLAELLLVGRRSVRTEVRRRSSHRQGGLGAGADSIGWEQLVP